MTAQKHTQGQRGGTHEMRVASQKLATILRKYPVKNTTIRNAASAQHQQFVAPPTLIPPMQIGYQNHNHLNSFCL
jgi:hypothetical protein